MTEEENVIDEGECDLNSSIFKESFISKLRVRSKRKRGF